MMDEFGILITTIFSFGLAALTMPWFIAKMEQKELMVRDYYKPGEKRMANNAGILILFVVFVTIIVTPMIFRAMNGIFGTELIREFNDLDTAVLMTVLLFAFYGVLDDYIDVGRFSKVVIPLMFSYPLVIVLTSWRPWIPIFGDFRIDLLNIPLLGLGVFTGAMLLKYIIVPVYIMVVANMKNMHAGFNGLQSGCALIVLSFIMLKAAVDDTAFHGEDRLHYMYTIAAILGAQAVFFWYNKHPSRIIEGNIGSLAIGSAIGAALVIQHYLFAGFVMLFPHVINFLMYIYWRVQHRKRPDDPRYEIVKWGSVREDGTLDVPNRLTLKWVLPYHFRMTERQATYSMYLLTTVFCVVGLFVPGGI